MHSQWLADGIVLGCSYGLLAASLGLIRLVIRFFDFSHAAVYTIAAYTAYELTLRGAAFPLAVGGAIAAAILLGLILHAVVFRPLHARHATAEILLLASLGVLIALDNAVSLIWGDATVAISGRIAKEGLLIAGARVTETQLLIVAINSGVGLALWIIMRFTQFGIILRATGADAELSRVRGIDIDRIATITIALASGIAAIVAIPNALDTDLMPLMGFNLILLAAVSLIAGGIGSVGGAFLGGIMVSMSQQLSATVLPVQWQETIAFTVLIGFVFFRPNGMFGYPTRKVVI